MAAKYKMAREQLANSLQELVDEELKKFKSKLTYVKLKKRINNIPKGKIIDADSEDLAEILVQHYGSDYAVKVVLKVLKKIDQRSLAEILHHEIKERRKYSKQEDDETDEDDDEDETDEESTDEESSDDDDDDDDD
ncbi:pyrin domain-containing protein 1 [Oryctolagus cuniculus]|uniref:pyrin domain-containing protein 1 n=1 Tax=Oryctolagus cuniculus TaxID=9986 RepID=UPI00048AAB8B|nr:pyrin domain-containing protein 1 [Oryctolagus cuniculus]XP_008263733.1 pyrin domain-containing protein 1 [Oryctolagus cuniculus]XP_051679743.1 pyrin domain-containing protein 1 [Oryctolagus cuniculus]